MLVLQADAGTLRGNSLTSKNPAAVEGAGVAVGAPERRPAADLFSSALQQALAVGADVQRRVVQAEGRVRAPEVLALIGTRTVVLPDQDGHRIT